MTQRQWLQRERQPQYSGINARQTLKALVPYMSASTALFGAGIANRTPEVKRIIFKAAREVRGKGC